jgi:glycerol-3-phosphate acyltransferase PlsY
LLCAVELARVLAVVEVQQLVEVAIVVILFNRSNVLGHCSPPYRRKTFQFYGGQGTPSPTGVNPCKTPPTAQG